MIVGFLSATLLNRMQFFEQKKGPRLNKYKSSMMRRVDRSILTMRGEHKSILESLRAPDGEENNNNSNNNGDNNSNNGEEGVPSGFALSKRIKGLKV